MKTARPLRSVTLRFGTSLLGFCLVACTSDAGGGGGQDATADSYVEEATPSDEAPDAPQADASGPDSSAADATPSDAPIDAPPDGTDLSDGSSFVGVDAVAYASEAGDASPSDAGDASLSDGPDADGGSDAGETTYTIIAALRGPGCLECAVDPDHAACLEPGDGDCEAFADHTADGGPAAGDARAQLCRDALRCALATDCMGSTDAADPGHGLACYCGHVNFATCQTTPSPGVCQAQEQAGLESTDPGTIAQRFPVIAFGAGMANSIALCIEQSCAAECAP